jgi:TPR repeat protein
MNNENDDLINAENGDPETQLSISTKLVEKDPSKSSYWIEKSIKANHAPALTVLGSYLISGKHPLYPIIEGV